MVTTNILCGKSKQKWFQLTVLLGVLAAWAMHGVAQQETTQDNTQQRVPDPKQVGRESESIVQVANLVYAGVKSSQCFSDHFLVEVEKKSAISTSRRFHAVKLSSDELFNFPMVMK